MIISASRRCDIPSYFGDWFINRLNAGYVLIQNPYNSNRLSKAILTPQTVDIIVFWTKNPIPFLKHLPQIDTLGYPYYFEFTLTPYGKDIEKNLPSKTELIAAFIALSKQLGTNRIVWRYDPIIIDEAHDIAYHKQNFTDMAKQLCGYTNRCVISFVDSYKNVAARMGQNIKYDMSLRNIHEISDVFSEIAKQNGIEIFTCAEKYNLEKYGIQHGACIDKGIIERILNCNINNIKDKNQRDECLCLESIDIGTYNCCANNCAYCYALKSEHSALENIKNHNPLSPLLIGNLRDDALITNRPTKSIIINQPSFFD